MLDKRLAKGHKQNNIMRIYKAKKSCISVQNMIQCCHIILLKERGRYMMLLKRSLAIVLALMMVATAFTGCRDTGENEEEEPAIKATTLQFSKDGKYTTTVTSDEVDLSGATKENTEVTCFVFDPDEEYSIEEEEPEETEDPEEKTDRYTYAKGERKVRLDDISPNGNGWDISFTDEDAAVNATEEYNIIFRDIDETALAGVEFKEMTVSSDVSSINASAGEAKITLNLEGSEFEDDVSTDDIILENAFKKMDVQSVSASGSNLTMQLEGSPVKNKKVNIMENGIVTVKPSAIKDGYRTLAVDVEVQTESVLFDSATLNCTDGKVSVDLLAYDSVDIASLTKDNIVIDGIAVESVEQKDDITATITFTADSANAFAENVNGKTMTLNGYKTTICIPQVSFYPVFDYCEEDGSNLKLTIYTYASAGTFSDELNADDISFGNDFEGASVDSFDRESDTTAKLIISVPAKGQNTETMNMTGEITIAPGALVNDWGENPTDAVTNSRVYSGETLGRQISLNKETLLEIQKYTRGRNTAFGELLYWGASVGSTFSVAKTVLESLGILESEHAQQVRLLNQIIQQLDQMQETLNKHTLQLENIDKHLYEQDLSTYRAKLASMLANYKDLMNMYKNAKDDYAEEVAIKGEALPAKMTKADKEPKKWLDWENATDDERAKYCDTLTNMCLSGSKDEQSRYYGFTTKRDNLVSDFHAVIDQLTNHDVFGAVDKFASLEYNFDTQAYYFRSCYRENALASLERVIGLLHMIYKTDSDPDNHVFNGYNKEFKNAADFIMDNDVKSLAPDKVDANPRTVTVTETKTIEFKGYIGEVKLSAHKNSADAKKPLKDEGYTIIDKDLNKGAGGDYIYLGYKIVDNYKDSIKDFQILTGKSKNYDSYKDGDVEYKAVPANFNRDLNKGAGGDYIYMYYTKGTNLKGVESIEFNSTKSGSVNKKDLNDNAGGDDIFMHLKRYSKTVTETRDEKRGYDTEKYPYCYSIGKKVFIQTSKGNKEYYKWSGSLITGDKSRKWDTVEYNRFIQRFKGANIKEELQTAGINLTLPLLINFSKKSGTEKVSGAKQHTSYTYYICSGDVYKLDSASLTNDVKFAKLYASTKRRYKNERYQEFTYFNLCN